MLIPLRYGENNAPILKELSTIFQGIYKRPHRFKKFQHYGNEYSWAIREATRFLKDFKDKEILEGGGAQGGDVYYFANRGAKVTNLNRTGAAVTKNVKLVLGDMATKNLGNNKFDAIVCLSSIEHNEWNQIKKIFLNLVNMAKPGAPLIFTVPFSTVRRWYGPDQFFANFPSFYLFNPAAVQELASLTNKVKLVTKIPPNFNKLYVDSLREYLRVPETNKWNYLSGGFTFIKNKEEKEK